MFDLGRQRLQRKLWIHRFEIVTSIIFCMLLREYDQVLLEESTANQMAESLRAVINSQWFLRMSINLFFNKVSAFTSKLPNVCHLARIHLVPTFLTVYSPWDPFFLFPRYHLQCAICSVVARNNDILKQLIFEAKREYEKDPEHRVHISLGDTSQRRSELNENADILSSLPPPPMSAPVVDQRLDAVAKGLVSELDRRGEWAEYSLVYRRSHHIATQFLLKTATHSRIPLRYERLTSRFAADIQLATVLPRRGSSHHP
ncbi:hypothetical protein PILCRDRAFT_13007 [Piloderma croceum F 1598]|uniref:Uncharacterized protein n=1 Tax=Piloderma croceum (strain F 1598) TaxID=765440 RepID=A0A0C3F8F1_PILCF|nr:hypothetical protein PILCRDRAFT_13007 [Piloderma croceum F 1598]